MSKCFICEGDNSAQFTWTTLFSNETDVTCADCEKKFELITGDTCPKCSRPQSDATVCDDCKKWEMDEQYKGTLHRNISVYAYNDFMKEVLAQYKFRGDVALVKVFQKKWTAAFQHHFPEKDLLLVPIPLGKDRLYERGFNQTLALTEMLPGQFADILTKNETVKQSKKSRHERLRTENSFEVKQPPPEKRIVLIDDIYTTGTTIRMAAKRLKEAGATEISSFTLVRS
ncbi:MULTISPECIES: ComF family protein [Sutcliffiella]|uniref:ComF family protein n=1 Tax=Sutcliffiella TaxID=2837511 RepID=UPI000A408E1B|nr:MULTISPECIES: ComF family protein [Sutcliffiella]WBL14506.1 ComF family protein [Sutcliffiella sp. NC1]